MTNKISPISLNNKEQNATEMTHVDIYYSVHPAEMQQVSCDLQSLTCGTCSDNLRLFCFTFSCLVSEKVICANMNADLHDTVADNLTCYTRKAPKKLMKFTMAPLTSCSKLQH